MDEKKVLELVKTKEPACRPREKPPFKDELRQFQAILKDFSSLDGVVDEDDRWAFRKVVGAFVFERKAKSVAIVVASTVGAATPITICVLYLLRH